MQHVSELSLNASTSGDATRVKHVRTNSLPSCIRDGEKMPAITAGEYHERLREVGLTA